MPPTLKRSLHLRKGDKVLLYEADQKKFNAAKLREWFSGPYEVREVRGSRVVIEKKGRTREVQENRIKRYYTRAVEGRSQALPQSAVARAEKLKSVLKNLRHSGVARRTARGVPPTLAKKLADVAINIAQSNAIIELRAKEGAVTQYLPDGTIAVEENATSIEKGKQLAKKAIWKQFDLYESEMARFAVQEKFEVCVCNVEDENAAAMIALAKELTINVRDDDERSGLTVMILPSAHFRSVHNWHQLIATKMTVVCEYRSSKWVFSPEDNKKKKSANSIFVLAHESDYKQQTPWTTIEFAPLNSDEMSSSSSSSNEEFDEEEKLMEH